MEFILTVLIIAWLVCPLFLIPYSIIITKKNNDHKEQIRSFFKETSAKYNVSETLCDPVSENKKDTSEISSETEIRNENAAAGSSVIIQKLPEHYSDPEPKKLSEAEKTASRGSGISALLITGVILVLLAGVIFVTTNWSVMSNLMKIITVISVIPLFFSISSLAEKKFSIHSTSKAFFSLGCFFIPVSATALFFFETFGKWFAFSGEGKWLALMAVFLACSSAAFIFAGKYPGKIQAFTALFSVTVSLYCLGRFTEISPVLTLIASVFTFIIMIFPDVVTSRLNTTYSEVFGVFSISSYIFLAMAAIEYADTFNSSINTVFALLYLTAGTVIIQLKNENKTVQFFCSLISAAEYALTVHFIERSAAEKLTSMSADILPVFAAVFLIPAVAAFLFVPKLRSAYSLMMLGAFGAIIQVNSYVYTGKIIYLLILTAGAFIVQVKNESKNLRSFGSISAALSYFLLTVNIAGMAKDIAEKRSDLTYITVAEILLVAAFSVFVFIKKTRSDIAAAILTAFQIFFIQFSYQAEDLTYPVFISLAFTVTGAIASENKVISALFSVSVPIILISAVGQTFETDDSCLMAYAVITTATVLAVFFSGSKNKGIFYIGISCSIFGFIVPEIIALSENTDFASLTLLIPAAAAAIIAAVSAVKNKKIINYSAVLLSSLLLQTSIFTLALEHFDLKPNLAAVTGILSALILTAAGAAGAVHKNSGRTLLYSSTVALTFIMIDISLPAESKWWFVFWAVYCIHFALSGLITENKTVSAVLKTLSAVSLMIAFMVQSFITIPENLELEYLALCTIMIYPALFRIWKEHRELTGQIFFIHSGIALGAIMITAIAESELTHAYTSGLACIIMIIASAKTGQKKWFWLGSVSLFVLVMYITKDFWLSIAWWVYLLAAGIILIAYAGWNEYCRISGNENRIRTAITNIIRKK